MNFDGGPSSAIQKVPASSSSFAHREAVLGFEFVDAVANNATYPADGFAFLNGMVAAIETAQGNETLGMYYNYADPSLPAPEAHERYWLGHYGKLVQIKEKFDPRKVFSNPQAVLSN